MLSFELTKDTPYLALSGELWSVFMSTSTEIDRVIKGFYCTSFGWMSIGDAYICRRAWGVNTLRPRQNGHHFADDIFKRIFWNENARISLKISLKFVPKVRINNIPSLVQIMAWRRPGGMPLSEPMVVSLLTHICVSRPQWVMHK